MAAGCSLSLSPLQTDLLQPAAVFIQIRISAARRRANMNQPLLTIEQEFPVIDEKGGPELNAQIT